jgi:hypothetical protein
MVHGGPSIPKVSKEHHFPEASVCSKKFVSLSYNIKNESRVLSVLNL